MGGLLKANMTCYHIYLYHGNKYNYHCVITQTLQNSQTLGQFFELLYYLFVQKGVYKLPSDWEHGDFHYIVWTLANSDQIRAGVPEVLVPQGMCLFAIYATSLAVEQWSCLHKTTCLTRIIMNPWLRYLIV